MHPSSSPNIPRWLRASGHDGNNAQLARVFRDWNTFPFPRQLVLRFDARDFSPMHFRNPNGHRRSRVVGVYLAQIGAESRKEVIGELARGGMKSVNVVCRHADRPHVASTINNSGIASGPRYRRRPLLNLFSMCIEHPQLARVVLTKPETVF